MNLLLAIFIGGGAGSLMRHYSIMAATRLFGDAFPYGTMAVNVAGSFVIGFLMEMMALKWQMPLEMRALMVTGFLGGFTTFSAFSFDVYKLAETGQVWMAAVYVSASVFLSLLAVFGGVFVAKGIV